MTARLARTSLTSQMPKTYSTYEAKARLSQILNRVRKGDVVTITHRGEPVAEVRPIEPAPSSIGQRLEELRRNGIVTPRRTDAVPAPLARKAGALRRFLRSRD